MKRIIFLVFIAISFSINAQGWNNVGTPGFTSNQANYTSLAINGSTPYLAFSDAAYNNKASVMKYDGSNWVYVGSAGFSAGEADYISLVINGSTPYLVFQDQAYGGNATVMQFNGTNWVNVGSPGFSAGGAYYTSIAFDGTTPYVSYMDFANSSKASVMKFNGTNWVSVGPPGFSAGKAYYTPIAIYNGIPYVAYRDFGNASKATVMKYDGANWVNVGNAGFSTNEADYLSLAFNGSTPYVAFEDYGYGTKATVMKFDGTNWVNVGTPGFSNGWTAYLNLGFSGSTPYVGYWDGYSGSKSTLMMFDGTNWANVGTAGFSAGKTYYNSFAMNGNTPYVAYQDYQYSYKATVMKYDGPSTISMTNPIGGEYWLAGSNYNITWNSTDISNIKIEYSTDGGTTWNTITSSAPASLGLYSWTLPLIISANTKLRLSDAANPYNNIISNTFTIYSNQSYTVSVSSNPQNGGIVSGGNNYIPGALVTVTVVDNTGYTFSYWSEGGNIVSYNRNYSFTINANRNLVANFAINQYSVSITSDPVNGGTTSGTGNYNYGSNVTVKATPNSGYAFNFWYEGGNRISALPSYSFTIINNRSLTANFLEILTAPTALDPDSVTQTSFTAKWSVVSVANGYFLDVALDKRFTNILSRYNNLDVGNVNTISVTSLIGNITYYYRVRAYNYGGVTGSSNTISVTTLPNGPSAPVASAATLITQTGFTANWNTVSNANGYYIDVAIDPNFEDMVTRYQNKDVGNVLTIDIIGLAPNLRYYYRVRAYNIGGASDNSNIISVIITDVENTSSPTFYRLYQSYPNPFNPSTKIKYDIPQSSFVTIKVYDITGKEVKSLVNVQETIGYHEVVFNADDLPSGVYFYRLIAGNYSEVKKMILMK